MTGETHRGVFGAIRVFPQLAGPGYREGTFALNASEEGQLLSAHGRGWRTSGHNGDREVEESVGGHAELFAMRSCCLGRCVSSVARRASLGGCREGIIRMAGGAGGRP